MTGLKAAGATVLAALVVAGIVLGGWQAGWWFTNQNVNRRAHMYRHSYEAQQTLRDQITKNLADWQEIKVPSQQLAVADMICANAAKISGDPLPSDQADWVATHCELGSARR